MITQTGSKWFVYGAFSGWKTKLDQSKVDDGANPYGQNTSVNEGDRISIRPLGYELYPTTDSLSSNGQPIKSFHTFRLRSGENVMLRSHGTVLEYFEKADTTHAGWWNLKTGFTSNKTFGFADININTDATSYCYFGNAVEDVMRWTGNHTYLTSAVGIGDVTYNVASTTGFPATGTISLNGNEIAYTSKTATSFTSAAPLGIVVAQYAGVSQAVSSITSPKGNILYAFDNRLFIAGVIGIEQAAYFSQYGVATNFVGAALITSTTAANPGIFNLVEGGGGIVGFSSDQNNLYIFKRTIIYAIGLTDSNYTITPLKTFDNKSQTSGAVTARSIFSGGNETYFITPDNKILRLSTVQNINTPHLVPISNVIKPTVDALDFSQATGVVFRDKAYFACKSTSASSINDTVLVWNNITEAWDSPIIGWNVSDFTIYNNGTTEELYFSQNLHSNVFHVTAIPLDYIYGVTANWRSKAYNFGLAESLKETDNIFVEGYIAPSTSLTINLYYDENGTTQKLTTTLLGTETDYLFSAQIQNTFGFNPFGFERFGIHDDTSGKVPFRVYLKGKIRSVPFYILQIEFVSIGENQQWEVLRYGFSVREVSQPEKRKLYRDFN